MFMLLLFASWEIDFFFKLWACLDKNLSWSQNFILRKHSNLFFLVCLTWNTFFKDSFISSAIKIDERSPAKHRSKCQMREIDQCFTRWEYSLPPSPPPPRKKHLPQMSDNPWGLYLCKRCSNFIYIYLISVFWSCSHRWSNSVWSMWKSRHFYTVAAASGISPEVGPTHVIGSK